MLGQNKIAAPFQQVDGSLLVTEFFPTIQGEGPDAGLPAVFVRLSRCNLRCFWCDTNFEDGTWYMPDDLYKHIHNIRSPGCNLVVITGGEPLLQNVLPLVEALNFDGIHVSIETAGTMWLEGLEKKFNSAYRNDNKLVCSPKTPKIQKLIVPLVHSFKYIVGVDDLSSADGLPVRSTQVPNMPAMIFRPPAGARVYVQAIDTGDPEKNRANLAAATAISLRHGYRLSVQLHKLPGVELP